MVKIDGFGAMVSVVILVVLLVVAYRMGKGGMFG